MGLQDIIVTPIYFLLLLFAAYLIRPFVTKPETKHYFIPGLLSKFFGAIVVGLVYQFYYAWGDTFTYFREARIIWDIFINSPISALRIIFQDADSLNDLFYLTNNIWTFKSTNNFALIRILSFINLLTFNTYSSTALLMACISFSGSWAFYSTLVKKYSTESKKLAFAILFIPSVIIWGSGILKDTITIGSLMWLSWALFNFIEFKRLRFSHVFVITLAFYTIASIKVYILICFLPIVVIWYFTKKAVNIKYVKVKLVSIPFLISFALLFAYIGAKQASSIDEKYALENLANTAQITAYDIAYYSGAGGSTYSLGELDGTWVSMLKLMPQAINVSLYRPYLWEVNNPLMFLSALESLAFTTLTIGLFFKKKVLKQIISHPFLLFCICFSFAFAFAVGVSTFNFGTLVRYKIPMMPFYSIALVLLYRRNK